MSNLLLEHIYTRRHPWKDANSGTSDSPERVNPNGAGVQLMNLEVSKPESHQLSAEKRGQVETHATDQVYCDHRDD